MPVSLCDGNVYSVNKKDIGQEWCVTFFSNGHAEDYLLLYEDNQYQGMITYQCILHAADFEKCIIDEKLLIGDTLWNDAGEIFEANPAIQVVPVFNDSMEILYIAKYDAALMQPWKKLCEMQMFVDQKLWESFQQYENYVHIKGINDVLFQLRKWLISLGVKVSVEGEAWKAFGVEGIAGWDNEIVVIDSKCNWVESLYEEYYSWLECSSARLKKLLYKPYISDGTGKEKIAFYLTQFPYFTESIQPLIFRYLQSDKECVLIFPNIKMIMSRGADNINKMINLIGKFEALGAKCYVADEKTVYSNTFFVCFLCSEYSGRLPQKLREVSRFIVAVQITALYIHMYQSIGKFEQVFSEQSMNEIDYLVASEYIADWICRRNGQWDRKILRFGYPKLDTLYHSQAAQSNIPIEWKEKIKGKTVFLFTTYDMDHSWLEFFMDRNADMIAIWRPHPHSMATVEEQKKIKDIKEHYNVIIDDKPSYDISFQVSDALIASLHSSVMLNYLYTEKPICLFGGVKTYQNAVIDYRDEIWYKCAYGTSDSWEVLNFIKRVGRGEELIGKDQILYRRRIMSNFDGEVCNRIFDYFEEKVY